MARLREPVPLQERNASLHVSPDEALRDGCAAGDLAAEAREVGGGPGRRSGERFEQIRIPESIRRWAHAHGYATDWMKVELVEVNYDPAMLVREGSHIDSVHVCSIEGDAITGIRVVRNPDKLVYLARQLSAMSFESSVRTH